MKKLYSKRQLVKPDIFNYGNLEQTLKNQIFLIWMGFFNQDTVNKELANYIWGDIYLTLLKEHGVLELHRTQMGEKSDMPYLVRKYFLDYLHDINKLLDVIELVFRYIDEYDPIHKEKFGRSPNYLITSKDAISELNARFLEHGVGYEFSGGQILRIDNKMLHEKVIKTTLWLTTISDFQSVNQEFLSATEHLRHSRFVECSNECLKAYESTLKIICSKMGWTYSQNDTSNKLISICFENNLIPDYLQAYFTGIRQVLESGIPTIRNRTSAHGKGTQKVELPPHLAAFMVYLTGTSINYLIESYEQME